MMVAPAVANANRTQITDLEVKSRLPAIYDRPEFVEDGAPLGFCLAFGLFWMM
jgi:hypothetical protein